MVISLSTKSSFMSISIFLIGIVGSIVALIVFSVLEESPRERLGTILLFGGLTLSFTVIYLGATLEVISTTTGVALGAVAFALVNVGGYITYKEAGS